ncbi:MAG: VOC family protein [Aureliella sp.]
MTIQPFHLAIEVRELTSSREFYGQLLGFEEGRSSDSWVDYDFFGHQVVCHVTDTYPAARSTSANPVDGHAVPVPHFGVILDMRSWEQLAKRLNGADVQFVIEPYVRFKGEPGEQATMFFLDPSGNALEFKAFADPNQVFAK